MEEISHKAYGLLDIHELGSNGINQKHDSKCKLLIRVLLSFWLLGGKILHSTVIQFQHFDLSNL